MPEVVTGDETATFVAPLAGDSVATNDFVEVLRSYLVTTDIVSGARRSRIARRSPSQSGESVEARHPAPIDGLPEASVKFWLKALVKTDARLAAKECASFPGAGLPCGQDSDAG